MIGQTLGEDTVFDYTIFHDCKSIEVRHGYYYYVQQGELGEANDFVKYRMSATDSANCLSNIYYALIKLSIKIDKRFWLFGYFFQLCDKRWGHSCAGWYKNTAVKEIEKVIYAGRSRKDLKDYYMWRYPFVGNFVELYRKCRFIR